MKRFWRLVISVISYRSSQALVIRGDTGQSVSGVWKELFVSLAHVLQGAVVRRPISAYNKPGFLFLLLKTFLWIIFSVIFKSVQSSTCWQNEAGSQVRLSPGAWKFPLSRASMVSPPSKLKMFTGSVCVLLTSVSLKLIKIKIKLIYATTSSWEKNKMAGER